MDMELTLITTPRSGRRIVADAATNIAHGILYSIGFALGVIAYETLSVIDEAIGNVVWEAGDE